MAISYSSKMTEEEIKLRASELLKKELPITILVRTYVHKELGVSYSDANFEQKVEKTLVKFITRECVDFGVPWRIFLEGAYRPQKNSNKILYHSHFLPQLYRHYASEIGLPLQTSWKIRYKIISAGDGGKQKEYREIALLQSKIPTVLPDETLEDYSEIYKEKHKKFQDEKPKIQVIAIHKKNVVGFKNDDEGLCYALAGCYDIVGAVGYMNFENKDTKDRFYFDYTLDIEKTRLFNKSSYGNIPTPYALYPQQIIATKWCRACVEAYYRPKLIGVKIETEEEEAAEVEQGSKNDRISQLEEKARSNAS